MKKEQKKILAALIFLVSFFTFAGPSAQGQGNEFDAITNHLKTNYKAKKVKIPFMWLARMAVGIVRPAGVKSFKMTIFEDLQFSRDTLDAEMQSAMRNSLSAEWIPLLRVRSRTGEQVYMYMREMGKNVKIMLVTIDKNEAVVIRARFDPDKLVEFMENPKIFGISLGDRNQTASKTEDSAKPNEETVVEEKKEESKNDNPNK